jgi:lysozyme
MSRKPYADALRALGVDFNRTGVLDAFDLMLDCAGVPRERAGGHTIGDKGLALIKDFEGRELTAYKDPVGIWTIGYGSTGPHVKPGMTITESEAEALLRKDISRFEAAVNRLSKKSNQDQFDAMVSLAFNVGEGAFGGSTLLKLHNAGDYAGAANQFGRWNKAGGRVLAGLTRRRAAEAKLYRGEA